LKELLRKCPHHGLLEWHQVQTFYNGLNYTTKQLIDVTAGRSLNHKSPEQCIQLFEDMANNHYQWSSARGREKRPAGKYDMDANSALAHKVEMIARKLDSLTVGQNKVFAVLESNLGETLGVD